MLSTDAVVISHQQLRCVNAKKKKYYGEAADVHFVCLGQVLTQLYAHL